jgi:hypothetical protein
METLLIALLAGVAVCGLTIPRMMLILSAISRK